MKNMIFMPLSLSLKTPPNHPRKPSSTTGGHHESLLLTVEPPYGEECFNQRGILRIHLKDSVENKVSILFRSSYEVVLTSIFFS